MITKANSPTGPATGVRLFFRIAKLSAPLLTILPCPLLSFGATRGARNFAEIGDQCVYVTEGQTKRAWRSGLNGRPSGIERSRASSERVEQRIPIKLKTTATTLTTVTTRGNLQRSKRDITGANIKLIRTARISGRRNSFAEERPKK
jgi:hypothetical protein